MQLSLCIMIKFQFFFCVSGFIWGVTHSFFVKMIKARKSKQKRKNMLTIS